MVDEKVLADVKSHHGITTHKLVRHRIDPTRPGADYNIIVCCTSCRKAIRYHTQVELNRGRLGKDVTYRDVVESVKALLLGE